MTGHMNLCKELVFEGIRNSFRQKKSTSVDEIFQMTPDWN